MILCKRRGRAFFKELQAAGIADFYNRDACLSVEAVQTALTPETGAYLAERHAVAAVRAEETEQVRRIHIENRGAPVHKYRNLVKNGGIYNDILSIMRGDEFIHKPVYFRIYD